MCELPFNSCGLTASERVWKTRPTRRREAPDSDTDARRMSSTRGPENKKAGRLREPAFQRGRFGPKGPDRTQGVVAGAVGAAGASGAEGASGTAGTSALAASAA